MPYWLEWLLGLGALFYTAYILIRIPDAAKAAESAADSLLSIKIDIEEMRGTLERVESILDKIETNTSD